MFSGMPQKIHRGVDIAVGLMSGWYRVKTELPAQAENENVHYVYDRSDLLPRIERAQSGMLTSQNMAMVGEAMRLVEGIDKPKICDFGGAYGEDCLRLQRFLPDAQCTVVEIPEIVGAAAQVGELSTVSFRSEVPECDLFVSTGVVMNAHVPLQQAVATAQPPRLLIASVEITEGPSYWSTVVYKKTGRKCPYITFNRQEFLNLFPGYRLLRSWHQGENNSGPFLNGQKNPDAFSFSFLRSDLMEKITSPLRSVMMFFCMIPV